MSKQTVLVIEDDPAVGRMLCMVLQGAGYATALESTGAAGLRSLSRCAPDAVVLDLGLPDRLSPAVLDWLRSGETALPWIVISAMDPTDAARRHGPFEGRFIAKPFDPWLLVGRLEQMLGGKSIA